jgi:uncharacterized damage-inducible protein DinB
MIPMFQRLFAHMVWADSALLAAVRARDGAYSDEELRKWLHHILVVERFFLSRFLDHPFDMQKEGQVPESLDALESLFKDTHADAQRFIESVDEAQLSRQIELPRMKEFRPEMRDLMMQVVMHSEHHRAQCAMRLRALGGSPSVTDYIMWVRERTTAAGA